MTRVHQKVADLGLFEKVLLENATPELYFLFALTCHSCGDPVTGNKRKAAVLALTELYDRTNPPQEPNSELAIDIPKIHTTRVMT